MKILILGAGAVGGYWGARLHQAGIDVTFLLREKRAETVRRNGLVVKSPKTGDVTLPVKVVTKATEGGPYHVVILHSSFSGTQFVEAMAQMPEVTWDTVELGVRTTSIRRLADGRITFHIGYEYQ